LPLSNGVGRVTSNGLFHGLGYRFDEASRWLTRGERLALASDRRCNHSPSRDREGGHVGRKIERRHPRAGFKLDWEELSRSERRVNQRGPLVSFHFSPKGIFGVCLDWGEAKKASPIVNANLRVALLTSKNVKREIQPLHRWPTASQFSTQLSFLRFHQSDSIGSQMCPPK